MVEKKEKTEPKATTAAKKVAAPKAEVKVKKGDAPKKSGVPSAQAPAKEKKPAASSGKTITVTQVASPIGRQKKQRATLIGLRLNKIRRTSPLVDTPSVRGMIEIVKHLVRGAE